MQVRSEYKIASQYKGLSLNMRFKTVHISNRTDTVISILIRTDTVISLYQGRFYARCAKNSSLYREYRYIGVLSHTFYCNFCRDIAYLSLYIPGISLYRGSL